ncbi:MAG: DUF6020 family protein [Lachnospiraceae bacterium]|nr:DUF6020 family protein [Lachnospiraceae bacterium]
MLGSASIGIFCYVLLQMVVSALILSYTIKVMKTLGVRKRFRYAALLIYGVIPLFSNYLTQVMKDSLYSIFVVLLITLITESLLGQKATVFHMICIGLTAIGVCLLRNNGIYIIYALLIGLILCNIIKRQKIYILLLFPFIVAVIINTSYNSILLPSLGIQSGSVKEALSIPFQQTARYVKEYPEEVTEEEAYIISEVLDYENLAELYNPDLSDSVKGTYTGKNEMLPAYFRVWFSMFLKHPGVYLEATLNNCYAFFYVNVGGMQSNGIIITTQNLDEELQFDEFENMFKWRVRLRRAIIQFSQLPLISLLCNCGVHFWIAIYLTIKLSVNRHGKLLLLLIPSAVGILVCIAGPTYYNCGLRYALPIIYANPFLVSISGKLLNDYKLSEGELKKCEC